ncbi:DUF3304 domain-containing protein [Jeongeupia sp. USM3]|uniref:DUF3304 domain-containing protein n=1 Tax=Jeongeupia sp. USM3 TaxID=1906741 RepID=UPI00143BBA82|nr:DUF3304 domain-containing protein [Jeongeupia sp. USM3]
MLMKGIVKNLLWCYLLPLLFLFGVSACQSTSGVKMVGAGASVSNAVANTVIVSVSYDGQWLSGGGGEICCVSLPEDWQPGSMVTIRWVKDPSPGVNLGGVKSPPWNKDGTTSQAWRDWMKVHESQYTKHEVTIPVPKYDEISELNLVFLPCDQVAIIIDSKEAGRIFGYLPGGDAFYPEIQRRLGVKQQCQ